MESEDTGTDVSDVESTDSSAMPHKAVIKHRTNSSLGNHLDLVNRMVSRWGSMGDGELDGIGDELQTDSDYDEKDKDKSKSPNPDGPKKPGHRRKKSATNEMKALKMEREALEKAFDQYIDPDENGDVDIDEWFLGIQKLNVQLNESQQRAVYNFMDKEESGFIEKNDFVMFATARFDTEELQSLQAPILQSVRTQNLHNHTPSNLMNANLSQDWDDYDIQLLEQEMASAMTGMVGALKGQLDVEQEFKQTMERRLEEDPTRLEAANAASWTHYEVASWIEQMGMERYSRYFAQENVDGPMLLEDMTEDMLESNLGVRTIHAKKIMREIYGLKKAVRGVSGLILDESEFLCTHHIDDIEAKIAQLQIKEELEKTKRQKDQLKKFYENEMMKLNETIIELKSGGRKGKKGRNKKKIKEEQKKIVLPQPPSEDVFALDHSRMDSLMGIPMAPMEDKSVSYAEEEEEDADQKEVEAAQEADDDKKEDAEDTEMNAKEEKEEEEEEEEEESESESESESEDDGRHLFGLTQAHLTQVRQKKNGATPKQMNRFIKDLRKKQLENAERFCIIDVDTIMEWTKEEVAYWILSVGFEQYAFAFYALPIDGDMLIRDMNKESIIEDLGVMKIHSARILRQIGKLRAIIDEGLDEEVMDGFHLDPDLERPTMATIESLQDSIETLQNEREEIMQELEKKHDDDDEESGYFTKKVQDLETERNELKENNERIETEMNDLKAVHGEEIENLNNTLNEANGSNDELRKEIKSMQKALRKAKRARMENGDMGSDEEDEEESEEEEEKKEEEEDLEEVEITHTIEEIEQQMRNEMEENTRFGLEQQVLEWSPAEVCNWLKAIQFGPYIEVFYSAQIFGDVLIQDIGTRMLKKFKVTSMHIPKLLRQIKILRKTVTEKGVRIQLSEEIQKEMNPAPAKKEEDKKGKKERKKGKQYQELEGLFNEERNKVQDLETKCGEKEEEIKEWEQQFDEEKQVRIGLELELEALKQEYESLMSSGSKQQIEKLENLISNIEENKIRTVRDLNEQLNSLRIGCRLMQKEIAYLKTKQGFHPLDSLVETLGYAAPPKY